MVWTIRLEKGTKTRKTERIRDHKGIDKREIIRRKTFGIFSKTGVWKQFARKHSGLRITVRDNSIHKGLRTFISFGHRVSAGMSYETRLDGGRRFWGRVIPIMPRIHAFSRKSIIQSLFSNSWRNSYWTSRWSSDRENSWPKWTWNCNSITQW